MEDGNTNLDPAVIAVLPENCKIIQVERFGKTNWSLGYRLIVELIEQTTTAAYFIKIVERERGLEMVTGEYEGQKALHAILPDNIPPPLAYGTSKLDPNKHFYLTEFFTLTEIAPSPQELIPLLTRLHLQSVSPTGQFGFPVPTFQGHIPIQTQWCTSWEEFFVRQFRFEVAWESQVRGPNRELEILVHAMFDKVIPRLLRPLQTGGRSIKPTLCHGDLWHGNVQMDESTQSWVLFDCCAVYAHNEWDLSSWRAESADRYLFGKAYVKEYEKHIEPSEPQEDFDDRVALYALRYDICVSALWLSMDLRESMMAGMRRLINKYPEGIEGFRG